MYAVIETGGKQYRVEVGSEITVERLDGEPGAALEFERVLLVADGEAAAIGRPLVEGARVSAHVVRQDRADKVVVFKYKPKARSRVKQGHRQEQTIVRVLDIVHDGRSAAALAEAAREEQQRADADAAAAAARRAEADKALAERLASSRAEALAAQAPGEGVAEESGGVASAESVDQGVTESSPPRSRTPRPRATPKAKTDAPRPAPKERAQAPQPDAAAKPRPRRTTKKDD